MTLKLDGVPELKARITAIKPDRALMHSLALQVTAEAKRLVPRKTGNLGRSILIGHVTSDSAEVKATARYALYVEAGTKKHVIKPKNKKSLFFPSQQALTDRLGKRAKIRFRKSGSVTSGTLRRYGNAAFVHAKQVNHPGTKKQPFMAPAIRTVGKSIGLAAKVIEAWNKAA